MKKLGRNKSPPPPLVQGTSDSAATDCLQQNSPFIIVIMAAGKGTRMRSRLPKVLHPLAGRPLLWHVLQRAQGLQAARTLVVIGHEAEQVQKAFTSRQKHVAVLEAMRENPVWVLQEKQLGTAHAVTQAARYLGDYEGTVLIVSGDVPLISQSTLSGLLEAHRRQLAAATMLTTHLPDPTGYGRVVREGEAIRRIVEERDATADERRITEINTGTYCFEWAALQAALRHLNTSNDQGEYYLTDAIGWLVQDGQRVGTLSGSDPAEVLGINDRQDLARAEALLRDRINRSWMAAGVTMIDPATVYIDADVQVGADTILYPGTHLQQSTRVGSNCRIGPHSLLRNAVLEDNVTVSFSVLRDCRVASGTDIGPFAHVRPGTSIGPGNHIGSFVELKNTQTGPGVKAGHLTYLGDADVGKGANIGAGTITCNYDGRQKHRTAIGEDVFVGSDTVLIAPLALGEGAYIGAGSVVTHDVPGHVQAFGSPARVKKWLCSCGAEIPYQSGKIKCPKCGATHAAPHKESKRGGR